MGSLWCHVGSFTPAVQGFSGCGAQALRFPVAGGIPVPGSGIKLTSLALQGRHLTTGPPGKLLPLFLKKSFLLRVGGALCLCFFSSPPGENLAFVLITSVKHFPWWSQSPPCWYPYASCLPCWSLLHLTVWSMLIYLGSFPSFVFGGFNPYGSSLSSSISSLLSYLQGFYPPCTASLWISAKGRTLIRFLCGSLPCRTEHSSMWVSPPTSKIHP